MGTIIDDDGPPSISFESATAQANEGSNVNFSVLLSASSGRDITIAYTLADGTAKVGNNDYTNPAEADRTITIPANSRRGTISVATIQDRTAEIDEDFTITLNEPADTTIVTLGTRTNATGTIISDDAAIVNIVNTNTNGAVTEGGDATFEVTLYGRFPGNFSTIWTVSNGTAVRPHDYTEAIGLGTINFRSNERSGTISISTVDDNIDEADQEDFSVSISLTNRNVFTLNDMATVYINDNDSAPEISFGTMSPITEPDTSTTTVRIPVTLSHPAYRRVTVDFAVADGTATLTQDYTVLTTSPTLIFRRGDVEEFIEISIIGDTNHEADETFKITLSNATRSTIATAASTGVSFAINNDDDAPVFTISKTAIIAEGATAPDNTAKFTVTQTPGSGKAVSIPYTFTDVSAVEGTDYTATAGKTGTLSFPASNSPAASVTREIEFSVLADNLDEFDETFTVTLSNPTVPADGTIDTNNNNHIGTGTITDDDDLPALTIANSSQEEGRSIGFTPTLSVVSGRDVVVTYSTTPGGDFPVVDSDYFSVPQPPDPDPTITIPAGHRTPVDDEGNPEYILITTTEDIISEPDETFILNYSADYAETADNATAKGTIENDDAQIITINSTSIAEAGGRAELEVTISPASTSPVNIEFSTSTDSASSSDYRLVTQSPLRFSANENKKSIFIDITNDTLNEADETITVTLTNTRGISPYQGGTGTITIEDDDTTLPTIELALSSQSVQEGTGTNVDPQIMVNVSPASGRTVTVQYALTEGTATEPEDFGLALGDSGTLNISAGQTSKAIPILIVPDAYDEDNETFQSINI